MWNKIKKLLGLGKKQEQKAELKEVIDCGVMYIYPKTQLEPRPPRPARVEPKASTRTNIEDVKSWMKSVREVDALYAKLSGNF